MEAFWDIFIGVTATFLIPSGLVIAIGIWAIKKRDETVYRVLGGSAIFFGVMWLLSLMFLALNAERIDEVSESLQIDYDIDSMVNCTTNSRTVEGRSFLGQRLFKFTSSTDWCWDGIYIRSSPDVVVDAHIYPFSLWEYGGISFENETGGVAGRETRDYVEGIFRFCPEAFIIDGCIDNAYPSIWKTQYSDGTSESRVSD